MAYSNYNCCDEDEFYDDMERFKYIKKLFTTYRKKGEIKDRLVINHIITLYNTFEPTALGRILFFKFEKDLDLLIPFLKALDFMPEVILDLHEKNSFIDPNLIMYDQKLYEQILKNLKSNY